MAYASTDIAQPQRQGSMPRGQAAEIEHDDYEAPYKVADLVAMFEDAEEASESARRQSERCRDYYDGKQLTAEEKRKLGIRGQPEVIRNRIKRKVNFLTGWEAKNRTDPKAYPNNEDDEDAAGAATDMLRFQERINVLDQKFSDVWENEIIEGFGGVEVLGPSPIDPRVMEVKRWKWDRLFYDPASSEHDFSDATYMGGIVWMEQAAAIKKWPKAKAIIEHCVLNETRSGTYDDKPKARSWVTRSSNGKRVRVRIVQMYYIVDEVWHWCVFTQGGIIEQGEVAFHDEQGRSVCPLLLASAYVDRDNNRYGEVLEFLTVQDEINKRGSKALHLLNSNQTIGEQGAVQDINKFKREKAAPDGHMETAAGGIDKVQFVNQDNKIRGNLELLQEAKAEIDQAGPNASLTGTQSNAPSGRAIRANQEGGLVEGHRLQDRHNSFKLRVYRALWQRCRQFLDAETWVRVTDDEDNVRFVGFNIQTTKGEKLLERAQKEGIPDEEIQMWMQNAQQNPEMMADLQTPIVENVPAEMDVDILIETASESVNMAAEAFELVAARGDVPFDIVLELWPGSPKLKRRIREKMEKGSQAQQQQMAQADAIKADNVVADTEGKRAKAAKDLAQAGQAAATPAGPYGPVPPTFNAPQGVLPPPAAV